MTTKPFYYHQLWFVLGWSLVIFIVVGSLIPAPDDLNITGYDKANHLLIYALLMGWFAQLITRREIQLVYMLAFIFMGIALEFLQVQTGYRSFEIGDMAANGAGVFVGWMFSVTMMSGWLLKLDHLISAKNNAN